MSWTWWFHQEIWGYDVTGRTLAGEDVHPMAGVSAETGPVNTLKMLKLLGVPLKGQRGRAVSWVACDFLRQLS